LRTRSTLTLALAFLLSGNVLALAQKASGPPIPITPPASVYTRTAPSATPPRATAPRAIAPQATATTAAAIMHATAPGAIDCGQQLVVWANPATHIYHFSTSDYYGHTKIGSYMCENDAKAQGMRPGRTEVRP
jgi:hypothetical protein